MNTTKKDAIKGILVVILTTAVCLGAIFGVAKFVNWYYEYQFNKPDKPSIYIELDDHLIQPSDVAKPTHGYSSDEVNLVALCMLGEAEGECEIGKRLVVDTILNRVDSNHFPNSIYSVVYQPHQFSCMESPRIKRITVTDADRRIVEQEMINRMSDEVIFFYAGRYSEYGTPLYQVGGHCFSKY